MLRIKVFLVLVLAFSYKLESQLLLSQSDSLSTLYTKLKLARSKSDNSAIANTYFKIAEYYRYKSYDIDKAFQNFEFARQHYALSKNRAFMNHIDEFIAERYTNLGFYSEAIEIHQKLLNYYASINDSRSLANLYFELSNVYRLRGDAENNLQYLNLAIKANDVIKDSLLYSKIMLNKIQSYAYLNEVDSALIIAANLVEFTAKNNQTVYLSRSLYYIGYLNIRKKDIKKAIKYLEKSLETLPYSPYSNDRKEAYALLAKCHEVQENASSALAYLKRYNNLNDSIINHDKANIQNEIAVRYSIKENKKKFATIVAEKENIVERSLRQTKVLYFVGFGFILLLAFIYSLVRFYLQKINTEKIINDQQHEIDAQKIRELEDTIKINSMQAMINGEEKERERIAKDLHDSLGGLLSTVKLHFDNFKSKISDHHHIDQYSKASNLLDDAVEEVRSISRNLQPTALKRLGLVPAIKDLINRFDDPDMPEIYFQTYDVSSDLNEVIALSIYRVVQELLTNSLKYAKASEILLQLNGENDELYMQYEDDGIGFDIDNLPKKGMGLDNINSRINYLKGQIQMDSKPGEGISVIARIPLTKGIVVESYVTN
jgi:signal transduction histidine kinase